MQEGAPGIRGDVVLTGEPVVVREQTLEPHAAIGAVPKRVDREVVLHVGDALAEATGWGRLFVGGLFLAIATSLPELLTAASAIRLDQPELALGNIFGANMTTLCLIASSIT